MNMNKIADIRIRKYNLSEEKYKEFSRGYQIPRWIRFAGGVRLLNSQPIRRPV